MRAITTIQMRPMEASVSDQSSRSSQFSSEKTPLSALIAEAWDLQGSSPANLSQAEQVLLNLRILQEVISPRPLQDYLQHLANQLPDLPRPGKGFRIPFLDYRRQLREINLPWAVLPLPEHALTAALQT